MTMHRAWRVATVLATTLGLLAACGGDDDDSGASGGGDGTVAEITEPVTITVSNLPPETEASTREAFLQRVEEFEKANPNITIDAQEWEWEAGTFSSHLAGGTLPVTFEIPFTYGQSLIERGQLADVTAEVNALPYAGEFNPDVLDVVQDADDRIYGVPTDAYGMALHYNRTLFEEAGLDPDEPPTTWDDVREYAATIAEETGQAGYMQMTQDNTGGWVLTTHTYSLGGRMEEVDGEEVTATLDNDATREALEMLQAMRWEDDSLGDNFLLDWAGINQEFAAGRIGMYMGGSDVYESLVTENEINPDDYGMTIVPVEGDDAGVLGGGTIVGVRPDASDVERAAAVRWIDHFYMTKHTTEEGAVADAEALAESDAPVGTPVLPLFDEQLLAEVDGWVADYVNVPLDQMTGFKDNILDQSLVPEPPELAQELYAELDTVVQAVLTDEGADIGALLETANENVTALLEANTG